MPTAERNKGCARTGKMLTCMPRPGRLNSLSSTPSRPPTPAAYLSSDAITLQKSHNFLIHVFIVGLWARFMYTYIYIYTYMSSDVLIIFHTVIIYSFEQSSVKTYRLTYKTKLLLEWYTRGKTNATVLECAHIKI